MCITSFYYFEISRADKKNKYNSFSYLLCEHKLVLRWNGSSVT